MILANLECVTMQKRLSFIQLSVFSFAIEIYSFKFAVVLIVVVVVVAVTAVILLCYSCFKHHYILPREIRDYLVAFVANSI